MAVAKHTAIFVFRGGLRMKMFRNLMPLIVAATLLLQPMAVCAVQPGQKQTSDQNIVVVIDPGHGGTNIGGQIPGLDEKNMTLVTALAMKEELEKYEGITVYLTRYGDETLSLQERAQLAAAVNADFLFSLHYNKAVPPRLYGAEVWIPSLGDNYAKGYAVGDLVLNELCDQYGLYRRGIKTKINTRGTDYYGVIQHSVSLGIPAVIIEHCHIDNNNDLQYFNSIEKMQKFGQLDATGVAKYFRLKSKALGVDYSGQQIAAVGSPAVPVVQDLTPPEKAEIQYLSGANGEVQIRINASDSQSGIYYYDYSTDGGVTFSDLLAWEHVGNTKTVWIPTGGKQITVRVYNQYDLCTQSNILTVK